MLYKIENLNECFDEIIKKIFNRDSSIPMIFDNLAENKFYIDEYKELKNYLSIKEFELNKIINSSFIMKFYKDFVPLIKQKWLKK